MIQCLGGNEFVFIYQQNKWFECPPMSVGRASPAVAATNSLLYVIGGDQTSEVNDFYRAQVRIIIYVSKRY